MDSASQPPGESCVNLERATSAQLYDRGVHRLAAVLIVLAVAGCARDDGEADLPSACRSDAAAFVSALSAAPSPVRLDGVAISDCLAKDSSQGDVQLVGSVLLSAAQRLGEERQALPLGYLVGALRRGARRSQGIHFELVRRVEQEAAPLRDLPGFARGLRAGRTSG
jgi:hypothetical protein